jgi:hypothetical protein
MDLSSEHMKEIVSLTFQYIRFLQLHGIIPWLYEEVTYLYIYQGWQVGLIVLELKPHDIGCSD